MTSLFGKDTGKKEEKRLHFKSLAAKASESNKKTTRRTTSANWGIFGVLNNPLPPKLASAELRKREDKTKTGGNFPFPLFRPANFLRRACFLLSRVPHYLRAWNRLLLNLPINRQLKMN